MSGLATACDAIDMGGEIARRAARDFAVFEAVESAVAIGNDVTLGGGDADMGEAGGVQPGVSEMDRPEDIHLAANDRVGMPVAVRENGRLDVRSQSRAKPGCHPELQDRAGETISHLKDPSKTETDSHE